MSGACMLCGQASNIGKHGLSAAAAAEYRQAFCPRCSGIGVVRCATATTYYFKCECSVWWSEPIAAR